MIFHTMKYYTARFTSMTYMYYAVIFLPLHCLVFYIVSAVGLSLLSAVSGCSPGEYQQYSGDCMTCPKGTYSESPPSYRCLNCPNATSTMTDGATNHSDCVCKSTNSKTFTNVAIKSRIVVKQKGPPYSWGKFTIQVYSPKLL